MDDCLATVADLLTLDGDSKLQIDQKSGRNAYGGTPWPDESLLDFGSCTASVISRRGLEAAALAHGFLTPPSETNFRERLQHQQIERLSHWILGQNQAEVEITFQESGTEALVQAVRCAGPSPHTSTLVICSSQETGRSVHDSLAPWVESLIAVEARRPAEIDPDPEQIDQRFIDQVKSSLASNREVILVLTDISKSGLVIPSPECAKKLAEAAPDRVHVVVDACQFRLGRSTLLTYLDQGWGTVITGSKFMGGPPFSGAFLKRGNPLHRPVSTAKLGTLLRWEAALTEMERWYRAPLEKLPDLLRLFNESLDRRVRASSVLQSLSTPSPTRWNNTPTLSWDRWPTTFNLILTHPDTRQRLGMDALQRLFLKISQPRPGDIHGRIGQPFEVEALGPGEGALRLCLGARNLIPALQNADTGQTQLIQDADRLLGLIERLVVS